MFSSGTQRRLATGGNALLVSGLVVAIVVLLVGFAERNALRFDLSQDGGNTLERNTLVVLEALDEQEHTVVVTAFSAQLRNDDAVQKNRQLQDLLGELDRHSTRLQTEFVDFDADRVTAERMGVRQYGTVVVQGRGDRVDFIERELFKRVRTESGSEFEFLGEALVAKAIQQVLSDEPRVVYLLEGHRELTATSTGPRGLEQWTSLLDAQGLAVRPLNLLRGSDPGGPVVPDDASAVLIVGPRAPMTPHEESALREYIGTGGALGFIADPEGTIPGFIEQLGLLFPDGIVMDTVSYFPYLDRPQLQYRRHTITDELIEAKVDTVVVNSAPVVLAGAAGVVAEPVLVTSRTGWIERGDEREPVFEPGVDGEGPVVVAAALTARAPHPLIAPGRASRVFVMGDVDALTDEQLAENPGNASFALNLVLWLAGDDDKTRLVGRRTVVRQLPLSPEQRTRVRWLVMLFMPLLSLLAGLGVWWARRGR